MQGRTQQPALGNWGAAGALANCRGLESDFLIETTRQPEPSRRTQRFEAAYFEDTRSTLSPPADRVTHKAEGECGDEGIRGQLECRRMAWRDDAAGWGGRGEYSRPRAAMMARQLGSSSKVVGGAVPLGHPNTKHTICNGLYPAATLPAFPSRQVAFRWGSSWCWRAADMETCKTKWIIVMECKERFEVTLGALAIVLNILRAGIRTGPGQGSADTRTNSSSTSQSGQ
ncbi:hypothetical protein QBC39DRAFT_347786 [Podospora conica]|nr:hypothetical protein QBC39DRAFT_347786 [Schizothecium conicum]